MARFMILVFLLLLIYKSTSFGYENTLDMKEIVLFKPYYSSDSIQVEYYYVIEESEVLDIFNKELENMFTLMKRFKISKYDFVISSKNLEKFIEYVNKYREKTSLDKLYLDDPKWGTITISPEQLDKILNSYHIIIPNIRKISMKRNGELFLLYVDLSIKVFDPMEGKIVFSAEAKKQFKETDFADILGNTPGLITILKLSIKKTLEEISYQLRGFKDYKISSYVTTRKNNTIKSADNFEKGFEMEVFRISKLEVGGKIREKEEFVGLVKFKDQYNNAIIIFGDPKEGDFLQDALVKGIYTKASLNMISYKNIFFEKDKSQNSILTNESQSYLIPYISLNFLQEYGFGYESGTSVGVAITRDSSIILISELLFQYSLYFWNVKMKPNLGLNISGYLYIDPLSPLNLIPGWKEVASYFVFFVSSSFGGQFGLEIEILLHKNFLLSAQGGYRFTIVPFHSILFSFLGVLGSGYTEFSVPMLSLAGPYFGGAASIRF